MLVRHIFKNRKKKKENDSQIRKIKVKKKKHEGTTSIGNIDVPIHFPNDIEDFQVLIEELKN